MDNPRDWIRDAIQGVREEVPKCKDLGEEFIFGIVAFKFFYNDGQYTALDHNNSFTDGKSDGGIDLIAVDESQSPKQLVFIQSKDIKKLSPEGYQEIFDKMVRTIKKLLTNSANDLNVNIRKVFQEKIDDTDESPPIVLSLYLGFDEDEKTKERILDSLSNNPQYKSYQINIQYLSDIAEQIKNIKEPQAFVEEDRIGIFKEHGVIEYGDNGLLVNISAKSLVKLYNKYQHDGLFEQNFRYYIRNAKIDEKIKKSISSKGDKFWFLNNGIIIACRDFQLDGDNVKLYDFSVVNGCQTTTLLGKCLAGDVDFPVSCKILKPTNENSDQELAQFISDVAEASNSQKSISPKDLKSNHELQKQWKRELEIHEPKIYVKIKRGEPSPPRNIEKWQSISNDELGQIILACMLQQPGKARSDKNSIFGTDSIYQAIYGREIDKSVIEDLLRLNDYYVNYTKSNANTMQIERSNIAKNAKLAILALIYFMIAINRQEVPDLNEYNETSSSLERWNKIELKCGLFNKKYESDYEEILYSLFDDIIDRLESLYSDKSETETSVSNFFKTDKKYREIIRLRIVNKLQLQLDRKQLMGKVTPIFS